MTDSVDRVVMCGILAIATARGERVSIGDDVAARMRDCMVHRGPDGAGLWRDGHVVLGHRRLAVMDPTPAGAQPMVSSCGRGVLSYNGELYNDAELRVALRARGVRFQSTCDSETVLAALIEWGADALARLRGMYALAFFDRQARTLLLARDPLGVKPLFVWRGVPAGEAGETVVAASEAGAILAHPGIEAAPDMEGISAYLTTIRTSFGERTMFKDVRCVRPGEAIELSLGEGTIRARRWAHWPGGERDELELDARGARALIEDSIVAHLRSDVPMCSLLSGGLDSSIIARVASERVPGLRTYCSGAPDASGRDDFEHSKGVASYLGAAHTEAPVTQDMFGARWGWMIDRLGVPLSTPNEVAINEVARALRREGHVVALSGEGADELFGGYGPAMRASWAHVREGNADPAMCQLRLASWVALEGKGALFDADIWHGIEHDAALEATCRDEFEAARAAGPNDDPLQAHLRYQRRVNLVGLLGRLDSATMLESVEGRTPFADVVVAEAAERLPMHCKFVPARGEGGMDEPGALADVGTKRVLRASFANRLPSEVIRRPKASFPLPFQGWLGGHVGALRESGFARRIFKAEAIETAAREPERLWHLAWPMINVALWSARWGW